MKSRLNGKDADAGKDWRQEEKGAEEEEMIGRNLNGHEFQQTQGNREDREPWGAAAHGVAKSQTRLSDWTTTTAHQNWKDRIIMPILSAMELRLHQVT